MSESKRYALLAFINSYRSLSELWDTTCLSYCNRVKKATAYDILIEKLKPLKSNATRDSVVKKINNFRSVFRKELKKVNESKRSGASANDLYIPSLWYYGELMFLVDQETPVVSDSTIEMGNDINNANSIRLPKFSITSERQIGRDNPCFIIAEIGQNHQGDLRIAKQLIKISKECGADCVKFQKSDLKEKFNSSALSRPYDNVHSWGATYGEHKEFLEFSTEQYVELKNYAREIEIIFTASAMDSVSLHFLDSLNVPFIKLGSGDANNLPLIHQAASTQRPLVISTGMQDMESVRNIYHAVKQVHTNFCLLHCISAYPTPPSEVNLKVLQTYQKEFSDIPIGYSGHEMGYSISIAAVALGAKVLERHITLDKSWKGSDHQCSLDPKEFQHMVSDIRTIETALGSPEKTFQISEKPCYRKLGKSLVAAKDILKDCYLTADLIKIKVAEPKGISAKYFSVVIGKTITRNICMDESICEADINEFLKVH